MSTPREKAEELLKKMLGKNPNRQDGISRIDVIQAKQCALLAVDEMLEEILENWYGDYYNIEWEKERIDYWQEVKQEIGKL